MMVGKKLFKKRTIHLVNFESDLSKTIKNSVQADRCFVQRDQRKSIKNIEVLPTEECIDKHMTLVCNFSIKKWNTKQESLYPWEKGNIWNIVKHDLNSYINKDRESSQGDASVETYWNVSGISLIRYHRLWILDGEQVQKDIERCSSE